MIVTIKKKLEETLIPEHLRAAGIIPVPPMTKTIMSSLWMTTVQALVSCVSPCVVPMKKFRSE